MSARGPGDAPGNKQRQQHAHGRHHHGEGGHLHLQRLLEESTGVMALSSSTMRLSPEGVRVMVT